MLGELELLTTSLSSQLFTVPLPESLVPKFLLKEQTSVFCSPTWPFLIQVVSPLRAGFCRVGTRGCSHSGPEFEFLLGVTQICGY